MIEEEAKRPRFWIGVLQNGDQPSLVIYDRFDDPLTPAPGAGRIFLYHVKRDRIIEYVADIVRRSIRAATAEERAQVPQALKRYHELKSVLAEQYRGEWVARQIQREFLAHGWKDEYFGTAISIDVDCYDEAKDCPECFGTTWVKNFSYEGECKVCGGVGKLPDKEA